MKWSLCPLLDVLIPPHCPTCDRIVSEDATFCATCYGTLRFIVPPSCRACASPFPHREIAGRTHVCERCEHSPPPWDEAAAALLYDEASRRLVLPLKYADRPENARVLGAQMARAAADLLDRTDVVVPVPLHRSRLFERRYNQAVLLARAMLRHRPEGRRPVLLVDALLRVRRTAKLAHQTADARRSEMERAIASAPHRRGSVSGRRVLLVDDVLTTGATARSCTDALREAGASWVGLAVAARTPPPRADRPPLARDDEPSDFEGAARR